MMRPPGNVLQWHKKRKRKREKFIARIKLHLKYQINAKQLNEANRKKKEKKEKI